MFNSKVFLAEFIGAFALIFVGAGAGIAGAGIIGVALAYGLALAVFWYAYVHISGAHFNPAVTFGFALNGTIKWGQAISYWIAQFLGALCAAFLLKIFVGDITAAATVGSLTTSQPIYAMIVEAILTFFLVNTVLHTALTGKGWAIGAAYTFAILAGSLLTGASLNPARTFGIALFSAPSLADTSTYVVYLFGPLIGATLAAVANNFFMDITEAAPVSVPEIETVVKPAKKPASRSK